MKLGLIRSCMERGVYSQVVVGRLDISGGWTLEFKRTEKESDILERKYGGTRVFKTVDAALNVAKDLGVQQVTVVM